MKKLLLILLIGWAGVTACKGPQGDIGPQGAIGPQGPTGPQGVAGPNHRGDLTGFVRLRTEAQVAVTDQSSLSVTAESNGIRTTAVTDQTGKFTLPNLVMGTYTLTYERNGYGTTKAFGIQHIGGASAPNPVPIQTVQAESATRVNNLRLVKADLSSFFSSFGNPVFQFAATRVDDKGSTCNCRFVMVYFSKDPTPTPTLHSASLRLTIGHEQGKEFIDSERSVNFVKGATPFKAGETVYAIAYGSSRPAPYYDPTTERWYDTALNPNPSNSIRITWP